MRPALLICLFFYTIIGHCSPFVKVQRCELPFYPNVSKLLNANQSEDLYLQLWTSEFDLNSFTKNFLTGKSTKKQFRVLEELIEQLDRDPIYGKNVANILSNQIKNNSELSIQILRLLNEKKFNFYKMVFEPANSTFVYRQIISKKKTRLIDKLISSKKLNKSMRDKYKRLLKESNLSESEIVDLMNTNWNPTANMRDFEQFADFLEFIKKLDDNMKKSAIADLNKIFNYNFKPLQPVLLDGIRSPINQFLSQQYRVQQRLQDRIKELEKIASAGNSKMVPKVRASIANQAGQEMKIFKRFLNSCGSGSTTRIASARKKFTRFKFGLFLTLTPTFYIYKNHDKIGSDPYFWHKLGHEMLIGMLFTMVSNRIFTNTGTTFWSKYFTGLRNFAIIGATDVALYDYFYGSNDMARYINAFLSGKNVDKSQLEKQFDELKNDPEFEKKVAELIAYAKEREKDNNLKNFLNKHINLDFYSSEKYPEKITQEDLEGPEAQEFIMQLLAEKIYAENMGNHPVFQSGSHGADRWLFYNSRNVLFDLKALILNAAIFQMMCTQPFGKAGTWGAIISLVVTDSYISNKATYGFRRDWINQ